MQENSEIKLDTPRQLAVDQIVEWSSRPLELKSASSVGPLHSWGRAPKMWREEL